MNFLYSVPQGQPQRPLLRIYLREHNFGKGSFSALTRFDSCCGAGAPSPPAFMRGVVPVRTLVPGGARISGCVPIYVSFRTSPQTGVGIPLVIVTAFFYRWGLPRQCALLYRNDREFGLAMTGNSYSPRPCASAGTPPSQVRGARRLFTRTPFGAGALNDHLSDVSRTRRNRSFFYYRPIRLIRQVRRSFK